MPRRSFRSGFSSSAHTGFVSGYKLSQNQGGGSKKAGLVPSVGNDSWSSMFRRISDPINGRCCTAKSLATTLVFTKNIYRGTDGRVGNWHSGM
jgi:hypothetical protein